MAGFKRRLTTQIHCIFLILMQLKTHKMLVTVAKMKFLGNRLTIKLFAVQKTKPKASCMLINFPTREVYSSPCFIIENQ